MSEVKRLQRYSRDFNGNLSKDPNGDWILFGDASDREGILIGKIGAQRLRADTAEAELKKAKEWASLYAELESVFHSERDIWNRESSANASSHRETQKKLDAADQRIADTVAKLELAVDMLDDDERGNRFAKVLKLAIADLNQKSEGERQ